MILVVKKFLLIFLLAMLPFQFTWSAAASYCQHEESKAVQHFGHHVHKHAVSADKAGDQDHPQLKVDDDCGYCHLSCQPSVLSLPILFAPAEGIALTEAPPRLYSSPVPDGPRKPQWRLAA